MDSNGKDNTTFDQASKSLPAFIAGGLLGGLLVGVLVGNIPYGVAAGVVIAPLAWFAVAGKRNIKQAPDTDADA
ncbi:MAG: hypothetical protein EPO30_04675 [Lysobacteraceae bacterium]|nr:MAG: hypothetical protein EPO30_04675 [Xanthomonadaceae bacterium]